VNAYGLYGPGTETEVNDVPLDKLDESVIEPCFSRTTGDAGEG
jgi:hypothetical protein